MPEAPKAATSLASPAPPSVTALGPEQHLVPRTALAESVLHALNLRRGDHTWLTQHHRSQNLGRHLGPDETRHQNAIVDAIATIEVFTGERLKVVDPTTSENDVFTWQKRRNAWLNRGNVDLASAPPWGRIEGYVQIRNAIQHGLGALTDFQLHPKFRTENLNAIRATGCRLDADIVRPRCTDVNKCFDDCLAFVWWLDGVAAAT